MIAEFKGPYRFLSNFFPSEVTVGGITYPTAEHAFQAQKTGSPDQRRAIAALASPSLAKQHGRHVDISENWYRIRKRVMLNVVTFKFVQNKDLALRLDETNGRVLIEGNTWHDNYWGQCQCGGQEGAGICPDSTAFGAAHPGKNYLGRILMTVRMVLSPD
jgi:N-glycosidase YbiA